MKICGTGGGGQTFLCLLWTYFLGYEKLISIATTTPSPPTLMALSTWILAFLSRPMW